MGDRLFVAATAAHQVSPSTLWARSSARASVRPAQALSVFEPLTGWADQIAGECVEPAA